MYGALRPNSTSAIPLESWISQNALLTDFISAFYNVTLNSYIFRLRSHLNYISMTFPIHYCRKKLPGGSSFALIFFILLWTLPFFFFFFLNKPKISMLELQTGSSHWCTHIVLGDEWNTVSKDRISGITRRISLQLRCFLWRLHGQNSQRQ